jgi:hypothetical protein
MVKCRKIGLFFFILLGFISCKNKNSSLDSKILPYDSSRVEFIELKNSTKVFGKAENLKLVGKYPSRDSVEFLIAGKKYKIDSVECLSCKEGYFRKTKDNVFALRDEIFVPKNGMITFYQAPSYQKLEPEALNTSIVWIAYLQKGENSPLVEYNDKMLQELISDSDDALKKNEEYKKCCRVKEKMRGEMQFVLDSYLCDVIETYNKYKAIEIKK